MIYKATDENINIVGKLLHNGGIVAIPTETVYGLAANALDEKAVAKIFKAKGRPADNPLIVHIADISELEELAYPTKEAYALASRFWPGPLTMILKRKPIIPNIVTAGLDSVAIRFPAHKTALAVIKAAGVPLAAPSANISGKPSPTEAEHVLSDFGNKIDGVLDGGKCVCGVESTVISLVSDTPIILRPGVITPEDLMDVLPQTTVAQAVLNELPENEKALSPGLKHKHYAPSADTEGVIGNTVNAVKYITDKCNDGKRTAVMCFDDEADLYKNAVAFSYGDRNKPETLAQELFDKLRLIDSKGFERIFVRLADHNGIGLAVYNRLLRACAFHITDADRKSAFILGLTGQSGAGKTYVADLLKNYGFEVIDTDKLARQIVPTLINKLTDAFGTEIVLSDGNLDRKTLAKIAFSTTKNTEILNTITHPAIMAEVDRLIKRLISDGKSRILLDGAALIEAGAKDICDMTVCVTANTEIRLDRIIKRDGITRDEALARFGAQKPAEYYIENTDYNINNSRDDIEPQITKLIDEIF